MKKGTFLIVMLALAAIVFGQTTQKQGAKVFISVDMEGIWGVVHGEQTSAGTSDYGAARRWMAEDVNAAIQGLRQAGAGEIVVNDSHGSMRNIVADSFRGRRASRLPPAMFRPPLPGRRSTRRIVRRCPVFRKPGSLEFPIVTSDGTGTRALWLMLNCRGSQGALSAEGGAQQRRFIRWQKMTESHLTRLQTQSHSATARGVKQIADFLGAQ